jgi:hypothetical protein
MLLTMHIYERARHCSDNLQGKGSFESGYNGPYYDPETPVRNTAHWLFLLSQLIKVSQDPRFIPAAHKACDYLLSDLARPMHASFYCRTNPEKDFCNGLIGQAWAMEGLIAAGEALGRDDAISLAREVFFMHPWLEKQALWRRVAVDGSYLTTDGTFNHQLWFAAIAAQLADEEATRRAQRFLDHVGQHVQLHQDGVVFHRSSMGPLVRILRRGLKNLLKDVMSEASRLHSRSSLYIKSVGYHGFNLYAFALLKRQFPGHPFWSSTKFAKMLAVTKTDRFLKSLDQSAYGWPYNPPGIEFAFAGEVFGLGHDYCQTWITRQFERTYNDETGELLTRNVPDPATSAARIYEAVRLKGDYVLPVEETR